MVEDRTNLDYVALYQAVQGMQGRTWGDERLAGVFSVSPSRGFVGQHDGLRSPSMRLAGGTFFGVLSAPVFDVVLQTMPKRFTKESMVTVAPGPQGATCSRYQL